MSARVQLEAVGLEFEEGGNTIWVHGPGGTILRIKCSGHIMVTACSAPCAHADVMVNGDIAFCVPDLNSITMQRDVDVIDTRGSSW